jgi:serine/threonine protein kinase
MAHHDLARIRQLLADSLDTPNEHTELDNLLDPQTFNPSFLQLSLPQLLGLIPEPPSNLSGQTLAQRYLLTSRLADSGFATVYLAIDLAVFRKPVIVKILDRLGPHPAIQSMFQAEVEALATIQHPGIVGISDTGWTPQQIPFLVLAYVPGPTLRQLLARGPLPRALALLRDLCRSLAAAHRAGIAHLDLKPENIIISEPETSEERTTILDFGIARLRSSSAEWIAAGTSRYMAPEQETNPTTRSDVYSLGLVAFEMLTGHLPVPGEPLPLPALALALDTDPTRRYPSASEFADALKVPPRLTAKLAISGAVVLLLIALALRFNRPVPPDYARPVPLVTQAGFDQDPALSDDGQWLYSAHGPLNQSDIYRQPTKGGSPVALIAGPTDDVRPCPLPGAQAFSFIRRTPSGEHAVMLQSLAPGAIPQVLFHAPYVADHTWTPDAKSILFTYGLAGGRSHGLARYDLGASTWTPLYPPAPDSGYDFPAVSPDGRFLAYALRTGRSAEVHVVPLSATHEPIGTPRQITSLRQRILGIQWTPDSREVIFTNGPFENSALLRVPATGGPPTRIGAISQPVQGFAVARNAWKLAYTVDLSDDNVWRYHFNRSGPDALERVLSGSGADEEASLSPDSRSIVFSSSRTGPQQVWLADANGANTRQVTDIPNADGIDATWTPDSRHLLVTVRSGSRNAVYRTPAAGPFEFQTPILENADLLRWSPDGRSLFFARYPNSVGEVWRVPYPELAPAVRLPLPGARYIAESPDGNTYYYSHRQESEGLFIHRKADPAPPPEQRLVQHLTRRTLFETGQRGLYYIAPLASAKPALFLLPYGAKRPQLLHTFDRMPGWGFKLAPGEQSLLLTLTDSENSDIYLIPSFR